MFRANLVRLFRGLNGLFLKYEPLHCSCTTKRPYQVSVVGRAGALLSDAHTETGQAAIFVFRAEMEGSRLAAGARWTFNVHLQHRIKEMRHNGMSPF